MTEVWKPVVSFEGVFEVSDQGRVRRLYAGGVEGWRIVKQTPHRGGSKHRHRQYLVVSLKRYGDGAIGRRLVKGDSYAGRAKQRAVHCLVLEAFVGPRPTPDHQGRHDDSDPQNNRLSNLKWGTWEENCADMVRAGTRKGVRNGRARLTPAQIDEIREAAKTPYLGLWTDLGKKYGVSCQQARNIGLQLPGGWAHQPRAEKAAA